MEELEVFTYDGYHRVFVLHPSKYRMRFASIIRKRWERGVWLVVTLEVSWGTSSNPRCLATEDTAKCLCKDAAWALNTLLSFLPMNKVEILGLLWPASERQRVSQDPQCCLQTLTPRETSLKGSQHIHMSLNLMNVDAPPRELIFVYN